MSDDAQNPNGSSGFNIHGHQYPAPLEVNLPGGGKLTLHSIEEVDMWDESAKRYVDDFKITKQNDLMLLGALLTQQLMMFRSQQRMNGIEADLDSNGLPTGKYRKVGVKPADMAAAQKIVITAATEIREIEKALGIDKKTREAGGAHTVQNYVENLKRAAHQYGVHISRRVKEYERVAMEARTRLRMLRNLDAEDRQHHNITPDTICKWLEGELAALEAADKKFAREKGKLFVGRV